MADETIRYGRGVLFPVRFDGAGDFAQGKDEDLLRSDLQTMFGVEKGDLAWDGELGGRFQRFVGTGVDGDGLIDALAKAEALDVLAADDRMAQSELRTITDPISGKMSLLVKVNIRSKRGSNVLPRDVEESIRLR